MTDLDRHFPAYTASFAYHAEDAAMRREYARTIVERTVARAGIRLLSLGVGGRDVIAMLVDGLGDRLATYTVVEGSRRVIDELLATVALPPTVEVIHAFFETVDLSGSFDVIEMGFVLEHVDDPAAIAHRFAGMLAPDGVLFAAVPNALSLHRRLGHAAGLLPDPYALGPHDAELGHQRFYDRATFEAEIAATGLVITRTTGLYLKPLTTSQIASLELPTPVHEAFVAVGRDLPDLCNGIMVEARRP